MRPRGAGRRDVVMRSIEDVSGQRCVDLICGADGWAFVECRRDPEDGHGWRRVGVPAGAFSDAEMALDAARGAVAWLDQEGAA
jgi:hypothetical protein